MPAPLPASARCVGYLRVSTERQADSEVTSLADQRRAIEMKAEGLGVSVGAWFEDAGISGATAEKRDGFMQLIAYCESNHRPHGSTGFVVVLNASRFGRFDDPEEAAYWRHHLRRHGWIVRYAEGDVEGDAAPIMRAVSAVEASTYRKNLMANVRRGMRGAASLGYWTRREPFGYRREVVYPESARRVLAPGQRKADTEKVRLTPHEDEARIVAWAFRSYVERTHTLHSLARELQIRAPDRKWSKQAVRQLLTNPAYIGDVVAGRRAQGTPIGEGKHDAHPAIVPRRLWEAAQSRLERNHKLGKGTASTYLLSGLMRCKYCGESYVGGGGGRGRDKTTGRSKRRFYRDNGGMDHTCPGKIGTVMRHLVDDAVIHTLGDVFSSKGWQTRLEQEIDRALSSASGSVGETLAQLKAARSRLEQKRQRLIGHIADGLLQPDEAAPQLNRIRAELADTEQRIEVMRFQGRRAKTADSERDRLLQLGRDFPALAQRLAGPKLRELVEPWIHGAEFDKGTRILRLAVTPVPAIGAFLPSYSPAPDVREKVRPLVRDVSLLRSGWNVERALEAIREAGGAA